MVVFSQIYTRLTDAPAPFPSSSLDKPSTSHQEITCTKCNSKGFATAPELHVHLLECAGEKVPEWIRNAVSGTGRSQTPRKRKWSRKRRRPRRGLKRNIPNTPQKPNKTRSKPGDSKYKIYFKIYSFRNSFFFLNKLIQLYLRFLFVPFQLTQYKK